MNDNSMMTIVGVGVALGLMAMIGFVIYSTIVTIDYKIISLILIVITTILTIILTWAFGKTPSKNIPDGSEWGIKE